MNKKTQRHHEGSLPKIPFSISEPEKAILEEKLEKIDVLDEIESQSDRGAAIIACALVDDSLKAYLKRHLLITKHKDNNRSTESLFNFDGGLGAFSTAIKLSFAMRLISKDIFMDLHDIREIRNKFAHWTHNEHAPRRRQTIGFHVDYIQARCMRLKFPERHPPLMASRCYQLLKTGEITGEEFAEILASDKCDPPPTDARERFIYTCRGIENLLSIAKVHDAPKVALDY